VIAAFFEDRVRNLPRFDSHMQLFRVVLSGWFHKREDTKAQAAEILWLNFLNDLSTKRTDARRRAGLLIACSYRI
jgi:saccharopine dehydrogenase-like NADP-dependent oxidoreductase